MSRTYKVAVVGATGAVGEVMLSILAERKFPVGELVALASERSAGGKVNFGNREVVVQDLATFDPAGVDIALFSAGGSISKEYAPKFAAAGAVVIDNSSAFRYDDDVPLVVTEVNPEAAKQSPARHHRQPQLLDDADAGRAGADPSQGRASSASTSRPTSRCRAPVVARWRNSASRPRGLLNFQPAEPEVYPVQIAFNVIPHGGDFHRQRLHDRGDEAGLGDAQDPRRRQHPGERDRGARAGVLRPFGSGERRNPRASCPPPRRARCWSRRRAWKSSTKPSAGGYPTPVTHASGTDAVYVGRIRDDLSHPRGLNLWIVVGQHPQGRGAERGADRRTGDRPRLTLRCGRGRLESVHAASVRGSRGRA